ncbi:MAG TPA: hypothetical protein VHR15_05795 [Ktedonobacterales bacterium]|jgi:hypothetical protein|nr:hypothetical protein [Ktedonobacterales bacterium]
MGRFMRAVIEVLAYAPWTFYLTDSPRHLVAPLPDMPSCSMFIVDVREDQRQALVHTMARIWVDPEKRPSVGSLLHVVNSQCSAGSFDFDIWQGRIAYRSQIDVRTSALTLERMASHFANGLVATEAYIPIVEDVVSGDVTVEQAAQEIERVALAAEALADIVSADIVRLSGLRDADDCSDKSHLMAEVTEPDVSTDTDY